MQSNENQLIKVRKEKLQKIIELGVNPYPIESHRTHKIAELRAQEEAFIASQEPISICGRLVAMRRQGKIGFGNVADDSGRIQIFVQQASIGEDNYELFKLFDMGDFIQVDGEAMRTQAGEYSIKANHVTLLCKNVRPLPTVKEKEENGKIVRYDEFADIELRYRKRYLDLLLNPDSRETFVTRSKIIKGIRHYLDNQSFLEVDTPVLQSLYGGANARPFVTHHNTLDQDLFLRIATELYLKRLVVGGFERVYEIGKNFRNEGMDRNHNPEFTLIEIYQAYSDLEGMMDLTEGLFKYLALDVLNKESFLFNNHTVVINQTWRRATMVDLVKEFTGLDASDFDYSKLEAFCKQHKIEIPTGAGPGKLIAEIFDHFCEEKLIQPTFVTDYPKEISPLAKAKPNNPNLVDRFELFIAGAEFGNAFSELNDPIDQRDRLEAQSRLRDLGDEEANVVDEDFLQAVEYGMPPMGGLGIGVDRLVMLLTENDSIKEVILFPHMKKEI